MAPRGLTKRGRIAASTVSAAVGLVLLVGCGGEEGGSGTELAQGPAVAGFEFANASAVREGEPVGQRFTCDGEDVSPALAWTGVPGGTQGLVLVLEDPDAPGGTFTHWLVYGVDPGSTALPEAAAAALQGENDFGATSYGGPCPPEGEEHRYVFRLLALHAPPELEPGADRTAFDEAVAPHVLAEARLTATYARP
jgi:Raf kinase inhibitor-like YbhB/YbcL family protein